MSQGQLERLYHFIPDTPYWRIRDLNVQGFPEGETVYDYEPYGNWSKK